MSKHLPKLFQALCALGILTVFNAQAGNKELDVALDVAAQDNGNVTATLQITNTGKGTQKLLSWYADLEEEAIFEVKRNGETVSFFGPHYKRPAPEDKDFIKLKSGETISRTFELSGLYDLSEAGTYEIAYQVKSFNLFDANNGQIKKQQRQVEALNSNAVTLWLDGISTKGSGNGKGPGGGGSGDCVGGTCFTGRCDNAQKNDILSAITAADQITNDSVAYLASHSANNTSARYQTWFGAATSARYAKAVANFNAINDAIDNQDKTFDCSCKKTYYAYVYPNQPYTVYLCRAFWSAPELGTDSRAGTIVHELSHFTAVAGTDDVVYGQSGAKSLAISDPDQALNNADSHEYFAENTPKQN
ncbi:M35 family metallo-endopeptidase [Aliiglaciecola sp. CAU 1673]|uniref:M35 family metallo-endopeptidase n=1 Tax=Aliiglaciecola sp. CAU 1673 TaxID=3032595 RepID=UPI0023DA98DB|nr:M35 family metallo-endopeptidase [Aliiglaciecola sp. CAU 1673]MDF2176633.1 M35 family metallo-endopeptidase [Aliiglaciecola sp. CAU 1673]